MSSNKLRSHARPEAGIKNSAEHKARQITMVRYAAPVPSFPNKSVAGTMPSKIRPRLEEGVKDPIEHKAPRSKLVRFSLTETSIPNKPVPATKPLPPSKNVVNLKGDAKTSGKNKAPQSKLVRLPSRRSPHFNRSVPGTIPSPPSKSSPRLEAGAKTSAKHKPAQSKLVRLPSFGSPLSNRSLPSTIPSPPSMSSARLEGGAKTSADNKAFLSKLVRLPSFGSLLSNRSVSGTIPSPPSMSSAFLEGGAKTSADHKASLSKLVRLPTCGPSLSTRSAPGSVRSQSSKSCVRSEGDAKNAVEHKVPEGKLVCLPSFGSSFSNRTVTGTAPAKFTKISARLEGGANNPAEREVKNVIKSVSLCNIVPPGSKYRLPNPTVQNVEITLDENIANAQRDLKCAFNIVPVVKEVTKKTKGTQSLYRESSMQTLPFLPEIKNDAECLKFFEVHRLPKELPNDHPPGKRDVEELERARKRWAYVDALKVKCKHELEQCMDAIVKPDKAVLEGFEWERWIAFEEKLTRDQKLRFDYVMDLLMTRQKKMRDASAASIAQSYEKIMADCLKKQTDIEKKRKALIRQKELRLRKIPRTWRKENIAEAFGNPKSEQYAPQTRYGKDPSRRHYVLKKNREFERRLDDLAKQNLHMTSLKCPYAKLKDWTKPKGEVTEVERHFGSDKNLKAAYEELRALRDQATGKGNAKPKCLRAREYKEKVRTSVYPISNAKCVAPTTSDYDISVYESVISVDDTARRFTEEKDKLEAELKAFRKQVERRKLKLALILNDLKKEELESLYLSIEGHAFGWILSFLSGEWERLRENKNGKNMILKMQLLRWQREGIEAGLRQKENEMRAFYQQINVVGSKVLLDIGEEFLADIIADDVKDHADADAQEMILAVARDIDEDLQRWSKAFGTLWDGDTIDMLCHLLKNIIYPNKKELIRRRTAESTTCYIIEGVLFPRIGRRLESYDISTYTASEIVDRAIDNDLNLVSSDSSAPCTCGEPTCSCYVPQREAGAIIRKLIRRAVSGRRWKTETERIVTDIIYDALDQIFTAMAKRGLFEDKSVKPHLESQGSYWDLINVKGERLDFESTTSVDFDSSLLAVVELDDLPVRPPRKSLTFRELKHEETLMVSDSDSNEVLINKMTAIDVEHEEHDSDLGYIKHYWLKQILSTYDMVPIAEELLSRRVSPRASSTPSQLDEIFLTKPLTGPIDAATEQFVEGVIKDVIRSIVPAEMGDSESEKSIEEYNEAEVSGDHSLISMVEAFEYSDSSEQHNKSFEYELEITQSEFDRMDSDICKCQEELEREQYIRELMQAGRVKVLKKQCLDVSERAQQERSSHTFEYASEYGLTIVENPQEIRYVAKIPEKEETQKVLVDENVAENVNKIENIEVEKVMVEEEINMENVKIPVENEVEKVLVEEEFNMEDEKIPVENEVEEVLVEEQINMEDVKIPEKDDEEEFMAVGEVIETDAVGDTLEIAGSLHEPEADSVDDDEVGVDVKAEETEGAADIEKAEVA